MTAHSVIRRSAPSHAPGAGSPIPLRPTGQGWSATLEALYGTIGADLLRVVIAPRGVDVAVGGARLFDPLDERQLRRDELLLGVGLDGSSRETLRAVEAVAAARGAGIVLRGPRGVAHEVLADAERLGVAVLVAATGIDWGSLHALVTAATIRPPQDLGGADALGAGSDDLSALADATAALAGGPVTIEDAQLRVLAFSRCDGDAEVDDERAASILGRRTPERVAKQLRADGIVARVGATEDVVPFVCAEMRPRRVIAIRAGGLVLGYVCVAEAGEGLSEHADAALREAARLAAPLLLRRRVVTDLERRMRGELLRSLLHARGPADALAAELELRSPAQYTVVAYDLACADRDEAALLETRTVDFIAMYFRSYRREALVVGDGARVYALVVDDGDHPREALTLVVRDSVASTRQALKLHLHAGIGTTVATLAEIPESRLGAERALRVGADDDEQRLAVDLEEARGECFLLELAEYIAAHPRPLAKPLAQLYEHDRLNGTDYVATLTVYLDSPGNSALAAEQLNIHPNTLRYRIRRLMELAGVDLDQPLERFALEAQLRLIAPAELARG
ncbi:MAG TPA: helix-turn-helix domain-containing protein [Conexibacter sp.]|nr:helix-turn-helix domain-containing protein [Conexibacter sp.]